MTTNSTRSVSQNPMTTLQLPAIPPFSLPDSTPLGQRWSNSDGLIASGITDPKQKRASLHHLAGPDVQDVFNTLPDSGDDYTTALTRLTSYFEPKKNVLSNRVRLLTPLLPVHDNYLRAVTSAEE